MLNRHLAAGTREDVRRGQRERLELGLGLGRRIGRLDEGAVVFDDFVAATEGSKVTLGRNGDGAEGRAVEALSGGGLAVYKGVAGIGRAVAVPVRREEASRRGKARVERNGGLEEVARRVCIAKGRVGNLIDRRTAAITRVDSALVRVTEVGNDVALSVGHVGTHGDAARVLRRCRRCCWCRTARRPRRLRNSSCR